MLVFFYQTAEVSDNRELKQTAAAAANRQISNGNLQVGRRLVSLLKLPNLRRCDDLPDTTSVNTVNN